tara:strand:- start:52303 stop:52506 length:204 start_codon:yes stop_codon:yes gene_type:complete
MPDCIDRTVKRLERRRGGMTVTLAGCGHSQFVGGMTFADIGLGDTRPCTQSPCYRPSRNPNKMNWRE